MVVEVEEALLVQRASVLELKDVDCQQRTGSVRRWRSIGRVVRVVPEGKAYSTRLRTVDASCELVLFGSNLRMRLDDSHWPRTDVVEVGIQMFETSTSMVVSVQNPVNSIYSPKFDLKRRIVVRQ